MSEQVAEKVAEEVQDDDQTTEDEADFVFQANLQRLRRMTPLFEMSVEFTRPFSPGEIAGNALNDPLEGARFSEETITLREETIIEHYRFQQHVLHLTMDV